MSWKTGPRRPKDPLEIELDGRVYRGWVSEIFKAYITWAKAEGRRLGRKWEERVWCALKAKYPHYIIEEPEPIQMMEVSVSSVLSFVDFMRRRKLSRTVVSTQLAEKRAAVCRECPMRAIMSGCPKCKAAVRQVVGTPKQSLDFGTRYGKKVQACGACDCYLDIKAWIPLRDLQSEIPKHPFPDSCWIHWTELPEDLIPLDDDEGLEAS